MTAVPDLTLNLPYWRAIGGQSAAVAFKRVSDASERLMQISPRRKSRGQFLGRRKFEAVSRVWRKSRGQFQAPENLRRSGEAGEAQKRPKKPHCLVSLFGAALALRRNAHFSTTIENARRAHRPRYDVTETLIYPAGPNI
jgi:hypothetical protein